MPQACTPAFMHRLPLVEQFDIGFAGNTDRGGHKKRSAMLDKLSAGYTVSIRNNVRNNISNFYSKCRLVFGMNFEYNRFLYTSNRFFVAIGCGAQYLCEWFPGIELLVENHKHVVWFKTEEELFQRVDQYLRDSKARNIIRSNAEQLAHQKHTYRMRIQNMMDIIEGRTEKFYGFIEN